MESSCEKSTPHDRILNELLFRALLAIRALDDEHLHEARTIAHIMHHVPITLREAVGEKEYGEVIDYVLVRADDAELGEMVRGWIRDAKGRCNQ